MEWSDWTDLVKQLESEAIEKMIDCKKEDSFRFYQGKIKAYREQMNLINTALEELPDEKEE